MSMRLPLVLIASLSVLFAAAEASRERTVTGPGGLRLRVEVPPGYSFETERNSQGSTLVNLENPVWPIMVSVLIVPEDDPANTTAEWQQNRLITVMAEALSIAAEKDYNFRPLYPNSGSGTYLVFTDPRVLRREPLPPGEFAHLVGGVKSWVGTTIVFQILCNDVESEEYQEIMRVFTDSFEKR